MPGTARKITVVGNPVLHEPAAPVTEFGPELATLIDDMFASMAVAQGVGLAAPQIGVGLQVFVYDCPDADDVRQVGHVVNPQVTFTSEELDKADEGCLSVPGPYASLERPVRVSVSGFDKTGAPLEVTGTGFFARCLLHETDHLRGVLYIDHLRKGRRKRVLNDLAPFDWNEDITTG